MDLLKIFVETLEIEEKSSNTINAYTKAIKEMQEVINKKFEDIKFIDLNLVYIKSLKEKGNSSATINQKINAIKKFYGVLLDYEIVESNPASKLKLLKVDNEKSNEDTLTHEEIQAMMECAKNTRTYALIVALATTGARINELLDIKLEDYVNNSIVLQMKRGKKRELEFNEQAKEAIDKYLENRKDGSDFLFTSNTGERMSRQSVSEILKRISKKTGIEITIDKIHPHNFRHFFGTQVAKKYGIETLRQVLKHSNITTSARYVQVENDIVKEASLSINL